LGAESIDGNRAQVCLTDIEAKRFTVMAPDCAAFSYATKTGKYVDWYRGFSKSIFFGISKKIYLFNYHEEDNSDNRDDDPHT